MPSTIGHAIAGATIAWAADTTAIATVPGGEERSDRYTRYAGQGGLTLACAVIAAAPDLDLLWRAHRTYTHSIGATAFISIVAAAIAASLRLPPARVARVALLCAAAHASHLLLDWLAADRYPPYGIQALWPFSDGFYLSGLDLFRQTQRRHFFTRAAFTANALAVARELLILGPPALAVWLIRVKTLARLSAQLSCRDHAAQ